MGQAAYGRPVLVFDEVASASLQATQRIIGVHHLSQLSGTIEVSEDVTDGIVRVDLVPTPDYAYDQEGDPIYSLDIGDEALTGPFSRSWTWPGNAMYVRYRIIQAITGGADPFVKVWHNGLAG